MFITNTRDSFVTVLSFLLITILLLILICTSHLHSLINLTDTSYTSNAISGNLYTADSLSNPKMALRANLKSFVQPKIIELEEDSDLMALHNKSDQNDYPDFKVYSDAFDCTRNLKVDEINFTLVTQLSDDRMWMMQEHCARWKAPMSVLIFSNKAKDDIVQQLIDFGCPVSRDNLESEEFILKIIQADKYSVDDYPVNTMRNIAIRDVQTTHLFYIDVDFWPGVDTYKALMDGNVRKWLAEDPKLAIIVPAFQIFRQCHEYRDCREENIKVMPKTVHDVKNLWNRKHQRIFMFDPTNHNGHGSTDYESWLEMNAGDLKDLECIKSNRYEPYIAVRHCDELSPYQEQFTGYGKNKMSQAMQMRRSGYLYSQVGGGFLVHYPHLDSKSRIKWNKVSFDKNGDINKEQSKRAQVDKLFIQFKKWLENKVLDSARTPECEHFKNDDSKLWV